MDKNTKKFTFNIEKYSILRLSIYSIALSGVFLGLLTAAKFTDLLMPKFVASGISVWEIYWSVAVLCAIVLPFAPAVITLILAPLLWMITGQTSFLSPITFIFDYTIPTLAVIVLKIANVFKLDRNIKSTSTAKKFFAFNLYSLEMWSVCFLVLIAGIIKWISHSIGGKLYWAPESPWSYSFTFNASFSFSNVGFTIPFIIFTYKPLVFVKELAILKQKNTW